MGRKTLESLPNSYLENRINYVITRNKNYKKDNVTTFNSFNLAICKAFESNKVWVIVS